VLEMALLDEALEILELLETVLALLELDCWLEDSLAALDELPPPPPPPPQALSPNNRVASSKASGHRELPATGRRRVD